MGVKTLFRPAIVHGNWSPASVTIEDGFGFEAVVPVKSPIKSSRWDAIMEAQRVFSFETRPFRDLSAGINRVGPARRLQKNSYTQAWRVKPVKLANQRYYYNNGPNSVVAVYT